MHPHHVLSRHLGSLNRPSCPYSAWGLVQFNREWKLTDYAPDFLLERDDGSQMGSFLSIEEQWTVIWHATALARGLDSE
jgi:hypothetical protein